METQTIKSKFEQKIKPILQYVGTIGAVLMAIAYIAIVLIMIFGFQAGANLGQSLAFAAVNAAIGLIIMQFLKIQGMDIAKNIDSNKELLKKYYSTKTKDKQSHSLKYFWTTTFLKDLSLKAVSIAATTLGIIYVVIRGTGDYSLLLLAVVNLIMFTCFGLLSLVKAYDFFNEDYMIYVQERIDEADEEKIREAYERAEAEQKAREEAIEAEVKRRVDLAKKELDQQRNDMVYADRGSDILESSVGDSATSDNSEPVVLDSDDSSDCVLGGTVYTRGSDTDCVDLGA